MAPSKERDRSSGGQTGVADRPDARTRLFVDNDLSQGVVVGLQSDRAHFLRHVLRCKPGELVVLFNGRDGAWRAVFDGFGKGGCSLLVQDQISAQTDSPDVWMVFAPIKRARIDYLIQKATELGVGRLLPVWTKHTAMTRVNDDRLQTHAIEAAEQCERLDIPDIEEPQPLCTLLDAWPTDRLLWVCAEAGDADPIADAMIAERGNGGQSHAVLIGPEGGFSAEEFAIFQNLPIEQPVSLGPRR